MSQLKHSYQFWDMLSVQIHVLVQAAHFGVQITVDLKSRTLTNLIWYQQLVYYMYIVVHFLCPIQLVISRSILIFKYDLLAERFSHCGYWWYTNARSSSRVLMPWAQTVPATRHSHIHYIMKSCENPFCVAGRLLSNIDSYWWYIDGFEQDCSISRALALEILQPCTKPSIHISGHKQSATNDSQILPPFPTSSIVGLTWLHYHLKRPISNMD